MTVRRLVAAATAVTLVVAVGCSEPPPGDAPDEGAGDDIPAPEDEPGDRSRDELGSAITQLRDTLAAAQDHLVAAQTADTTAATRSDVERALQLLLDEGGGATGTDATGTNAAVLPAQSPERGSIGERDDLLSTTLALARDVGGPSGSAVTAMLRDEIAGDLGAWERDAAGVVASAERAGTAAGDLDTVTATILELPGETTRALAWAFRAADAGELDTATTAAERGAAHLELATLAVDALLDALPAGSDPGGAP